MCAKDGSMRAEDATSSAKDATMSAEDATLRPKDATKSAKDPTMWQNRRPRRNVRLPRGYPAVTPPASVVCILRKAPFTAPPRVG